MDFTSRLSYRTHRRSVELVGHIKLEVNYQEVCAGSILAEVECIAVKTSNGNTILVAVHYMDKGIGVALQVLRRSEVGRDKGS